MHAEVVNGMNVLAVRDAVSRAAKLCRDGKGPVLLDVDTYRYWGHSLSDPRNEYRTKEEEAAWKCVDAIECFIEQVLAAKILTEKSLEALKTDLGKVRTGRASLTLLDTVRVNYYGNPSPLKQVANCAIPEPRLITIQPWDRSLLGEIEKAIMKADIGITPNNNGFMIRLPIPPLTEERRKELVKLSHQLGEEGRVSIRNLRRDALESLKKLEKDKKISQDEERNGGTDVQELTDEFVRKIDEVIKVKEAEIMEI
jgi:ribosome recycling factor